MKLLSREDVQKMDQKVIALGQPQAALIETVGAKLSQWLHPKISQDSRVLVLMGPGHNGDDAAVVHRRLKNHVRQLDGLVIGSTQSSFLHSEEKLYNLDNYQALDFSQFNWIIDGLFGTGLSRPLDLPIQNLLQRINDCDATRVAIDLPSGLDANTGSVYGAAFQADHTLTIASPKRGLYLLPGRNCAGEIHVIEVTALNQALESEETTTHALPHFDFIRLQPKPEQHKYSRGKLTVAMSPDFPGASLMVALAAQKSGAGYVQVLCPRAMLESLQMNQPYLVFSGYDNVDHLCQMLAEDDSQAVVIGAGWKDIPNDFAWTSKNSRSWVFDGGFLTPELLKKTRNFASQCVLTPHTGELKRLLNDEPTGKWQQMEKLLEKWPGVLLAKGYDTIIAEGKSRRWITTWNSSSLATAGSGDILAGILGAFLAQDFAPQQAACLAVDAHRRLASHHPVCISPQTLINRIEGVLNGHQPPVINETT